MLNRMFPYIVPLLAFLSAVTGIVVVGQLLLFAADQLHGFGEIGKVATAMVGLALTILIGVVAAILSVRAAKMPPVQWPDPGPMEPVRRLDLGAGYIVGQFVFFTGLGLLLLFVFLVATR
jgi:hypothetical protein